MGIEEKLYVGVQGVVFNLTCRDFKQTLLDLTTATSVAIMVLKPNGDEVIWTGTVDQTDHSIITYTLQAVDLDVPGDYVIQGKIYTATGIFLSESIKLKVYEAYH